MLNYLIGDATYPSIKEDSKGIIAHIVNDQGGWGRGFVLALSQRWPELRRRYKLWSQTQEFVLGNINSTWVEPNIYVVDMLAQKGYYNRITNPVPLDYEALRSCLIKLNDLSIILNSSIHMPKIGSGLAGGNWNTIEELILRYLGERDVFIYSLQ